MGQSGIANIAIGFEWTPFSHGFVFWEYPGPAHLPPSDEMGQQEWLEGFMQAHADDADEPDDPERGETAADALRRMLPGNPHLPALLALLARSRSGLTARPTVPETAHGSLHRRNVAFKNRHNLLTLHRKTDNQP